MSAAPQLRGLLASNAKKHFMIAVTLTSVSGILFKIFFVDRRRRQVEEFYKNYDDDDHFERMRKAGMFQSAPPDDE